MTILICPNGAMALAYLVRNGAEKQEGQKTGSDRIQSKVFLFFLLQVGIKVAKADCDS